MKLVDKVIYFIFSVIILAIVVVMFTVILNIGGVVNPVFNFISNIPNMSFTQEQMTYIVIIEILLFVMAIKGILFQSKLEENKDAIILENNSGKLIISRKTLENLVKDISNGVQGVENSVARVNVSKDTELINRYSCKRRLYKRYNKEITRRCKNCDKESFRFKCIRSKCKY